MKKITAIILMACLVIPFTSCANKTVSNDTTDLPDSVFADIKPKTWYSSDDESFKNLEIEKELDVNSIYQKTEYNELMLQGYYRLNEEKDLKKFIKNTSAMQLAFFHKAGLNDAGVRTETVTSLPFEIINGGYNMSRWGDFDYNPIKLDESENWALLKFADSDGNTRKVTCTYEVDGKTIKYYPVEKYEAIYNGEGLAEEYEYIKGSKEIEYTFDFSGPYINISNGQDSVILCADRFCKDSKFNPDFEGHALPDSPLFGNIVSGGVLPNGTLKDGTGIFNFYWKFDSNGVATATWSDNLLKIGDYHNYYKQLVYWVTGDGTYTFADENNVYYYTDSYAQDEARQLENYYDDIDKVSDDDLKKIEETKSNLFNDLVEAFEKEGISITVDRSLGEISLDNSVLFAGDSSELTDDGKAFLNKFIKVYTSIVYSEKYDGFINKVVIEGHTAPLKDSTYESGLPLSEERAENVKNYCVSNETNLSDNIKNTIEARGMSNSKPVYDEEGNIDLDACRRVSFVFVVDIESV